MSSRDLLLKAVLSVPAAGYHVVQKGWAKAFEWGLFKAGSAPVAVISIGNLLMGGSGKTPFAIALAGLLERQGMKPAVVSRGYRGSNREEYCVVGKALGGPPAASPPVCGDEPYLIAKRLPNIPVLVGRKRLYPARAAVDLFGCNVIVLDDGFQHLALKRDVDILLLNGSEDRMFPLGRLREPLSAVERADVVILVGLDSTPAFVSRYAGTVPIFRGRTVPAGFVGSHKADLSSTSCAGLRVALVSAIANPERFTRTVETMGCAVEKHFVFPDHHVLTEGEIQDVVKRAGDRMIVVTEKDWVKLPEWFRTRDEVVALRIEMVLDDQDGFLRCLNSLMAGEA